MLTQVRILSEGVILRPCTAAKNGVRSFAQNIEAPLKRQQLTFSGHGC